VIPLDPLRPPHPTDPAAAAYKEWLHLNVFDHAAGAVGLVNVSLHGPPRDPRSRVAAAGLVHLPGAGWAGGVIVREAAAATLGTASIALEDAALGVDHATGRVHAALRLRDDAVDVRVTGVAVGPAHVADAPMPLGPGWVAWYAVPRLAVSGTVRVGDRTLALEAASGYHDHNWGRWHWGEDLGWDWGSFLAPEGPAIVLARTTDRARRRPGRPLLLVRAPGIRRTFVGSSVTVRRHGRWTAPLRRLPGAMAALHQDRAAPDLPASVRIEAREGGDDVAVDFRVDGAGQIIAADPVRRGYGFIHELPGTFRCRGRVGGTELSAEGLGVFEHVD